MLVHQSEPLGGFKDLAHHDMLFVGVVYFMCLVWVLFFPSYYGQVE